MNGQIKSWVLILILTLLGTSCNSDKDVEILTSEDILPQAQGNYEYQEDTLISESKSLTLFEQNLQQLFPELEFPENNILKERNMLFMPDRLGYKNKEETYFIKDSIPFHIIEWQFEDSVKTVNAFYNWLDCFNHDCRSIRLDEEKNGSKEAFLIWVSDQNITYLSSSKSLKLKSWQEVLFGEENEKWNYILQQAPHGRIKWIHNGLKVVKE
nr:hypothetical protein [uncultured Brumimicrobium sp.]